MENEEQSLDFRLIAGARQVTDIAPENPAAETPGADAPSEDGPLHLTWFALGHVAVLAYIAARFLRAMTPAEQALIWGTVAVVALALALLVRSRLRAASAMAEALVPVERRTKRRR